MKLRLEIPDPLFELYLAHAKGNEGKVPELLVQQLDRFRRVSPLDRILVVDAHNRAKLEEMLSHPTPQIADTKELLERVDALAHIEIGGVAVRFHARDLLAIKNHAERNGLSIQEAVEYTVERMKGSFMSYLPEATAAAAMLVDDEPEPEEVPVDPVPVVVEALASTDEVYEEAASQLRPQDPRVTAPVPDGEDFAEEGRGRLLNPSTVDPADRKVQPRKPQPRVHPKRAVVYPTPAATGDAMRPPGWGAGSRE